MCFVESIYNTATATINAPIAPAREPARWPAAFWVAVAGLVEVAEPVGLPVVRRVVVALPEPDPEPDPPDPPDPVLLELPVGAGPLPVAAELPTPLPAPLDGESPPPDEATGDEATELAEAPVLVVDDGVLELEETAAQERSKYGVVVKGLPATIPKLGLVWTASLSVRVYHQVLVLPKRGHPTASQYALALFELGTARLAVEPLLGHPVSVIQTGLPPTAA